VPSQLAKQFGEMELTSPARICPAVSLWMPCCVAGLSRLFVMTMRIFTLAGGQTTSV